MRESSMALQLAYYISRSCGGRRRLAEKTGLSEMNVRTELDRLRRESFVKLERSGATLTPSGRRHFAHVLDAVRSVVTFRLDSLDLDDVCVAAHAAAPSSDPVWTLRDAAVRGGASAFLLLRFGSDGWMFAHDDEPVSFRNPADATDLVHRFPEAKDGDALLIAFGPTLRASGLGLWRALERLLTANS